MIQLQLPNRLTKSLTDKAAASIDLTRVVAWTLISIAVIVFCADVFLLITGA